MSEITKTAATETAPYPQYMRIVFAVVIVGSYFFGLSIPLVGPDEPRYAEVAREMFERGDWITPTLGGFPWFEKPALLYWLEIVSYHIFGVNEFAARLGPALCGLGIIACLWVLGRKLSAHREPTDDTSNAGSKEQMVFADLLALIAASTLSIIIFSHGATFDIVVTFTLTASLVSFFIFDRAIGKTSLLRQLSLVAFYFFIGASLLAKGLIGAVFPFAIVALYYVLSWKRPPKTFSMSLLWGCLLAAAVTAVWYVPMYLRHGLTFIDQFIIQQHFRRFTSNKYQHPQPFYFFFWVLPLMTLPWLPFFLAGIWQSLKDLFTATAASPAAAPGSPAASSSSPSPLLLFSSSPLLLLSSAWLLVPLVFFTFSGSKLPGYILPAVPPAVIISAVYAFQLVKRDRRWASVVPITALAMFTFIILATPNVAPRYIDAQSVKPLIVAAEESGHTAESIFGMHTVAQGLEFYAAGRLIREPDGTQRKFESVSDLEREMRRMDIGKALVVLPRQDIPELIGYYMFDVDVLGDNGKLAIVAIALK